MKGKITKINENIDNTKAKLVKGGFYKMTRHASKALILLLVVLSFSCGVENSDSYGSGIVSDSNRISCGSVNEATLSDFVDLDVEYVSQLPNYCGPAVLSMVLDYHGNSVDQETIGDDIVGPRGVSTGDLKTKAEGYGFNANVISCGSSINTLLSFVDRLQSPVIARVLNSRGNGHFVVVTGYDSLRKVVFINDPANSSKDEMSFDDFEDIWPGNWMIVVKPAA